MDTVLGIEFGANVPTLTLAVHLTVALVFAIAAALSVADDDPTGIVALQTVLAVLVACLGLSVARRV